MPIAAMAALVLGFSGPTPPLYCPATLEKIVEPALLVEYGGVIFGTCCAGCGNKVLKDPAPLVVEAIKNKKTVGTFEYDPVSQLRINGEKSPAFSDYRSIRYFFASAEEKKAFDATPSSFIKDVKSVAYFCPVQSKAVDSQSAGSFADYGGTRYFLCCGNCLKAFKADPAKFVANAASAVMPIKAIALKK